ncbi:hypothetical protein DW089_02390 [Acidaminococcus sp. AM05-11]|nr:hypothetical protein DW089_02390 [Acidaminococcus sp. AM05-11]
MFDWNQHTIPEERCQRILQYTVCIQIIARFQKSLLLFIPFCATMFPIKGQARFLPKQNIFLMFAETAALFPSGDKV